MTRKQGMSRVLPAAVARRRRVAPLKWIEVHGALTRWQQSSLPPPPSLVFNQIKREISVWAAVSCDTFTSASPPLTALMMMNEGDAWGMNFGLICKPWTEPTLTLSQSKGGLRGYTLTCDFTSPCSETCMIFWTEHLIFFISPSRCAARSACTTSGTGCFVPVVAG